MKEIEEGIFYINLSETPLEDFEDRINELAEAKGKLGY